MTSRTQRRKRPQPGRKPVVVEVDRRDAALLARAGESGVPASTSRTRARAGYALLALATLVGVTVPALLQRSHAIRSGAPVAGAFTGVGALLLLEMLPYAWRAVTHGPDARLVTARTLTGLRTVDLGALTRIRRTRTPSRNGWIDVLRITDRSGVSLCTDEPRVVDRIASAVRSSPPAVEPAATALRVSRFAATRLGLAPASGRVRRAARAAGDFALGAVAPAGAGLLGGFATWIVVIA